MHAFQSVRYELRFYLEVGAISDFDSVHIMGEIDPGYTNPLGHVEFVITKTSSHHDFVDLCMQNIEKKFKPYQSAIANIMKSEFCFVKTFFNEHPSQLASSRIVKFAGIGFFSCYFMNKLDMRGAEYDFEGKFFRSVSLPDESL